MSSTLTCPLTPQRTTGSTEVWPCCVNWTTKRQHSGPAVSIGRLNTSTVALLCQLDD
ncbi:hypothetical protein NP493_7170g00006 [Ridgeia piscesae]|uniref:Uncharacterized protein n=1 Tax=Ridgeia piscesae TaxID=27915 RepID=A0AAD9IQ27_RIDPI|nr:hypothetical protein NP493_7170g00006 [Ridgeia piscesae]